jgi:Ca-activated chloride channel family protein
MVFSKNITLLVVRILVIIFLAFSASGVIFWTAGVGSEFNYVLTIDASSSMLASDIEPTRFIAAKDAAKMFVSSNADSIEIGVVSFSGVSRIDSRLQSSKSEINAVIDKLEVSPVGGTDIAGAITTSINALVVESDKANAIIVLTDGQHTVGGTIEEAIKYANEKHVIVHTIGLATEKGGSFELTNLISTLDEPTLKKISANTGGKYFRAGSKTELESAFKEILTLSEQNKPHQLRLPLLIIGLALLFIEWILLNTRFRTLP